MGRPNGRISKIRFLRALPGTGGIKIRIMETLDCSRNTLNHYLNKEDWDDVRQAYEDECNSIGDLAEETVREGIELRSTTLATCPDCNIEISCPECKKPIYVFDRDTVQAMNTATKNARWMLSRKHKERGYGEESRVTVQGGDKPLEIEQTQKISIEDLDLPLETRKVIFEAMKKKKAQEGEQDGD